MASSQMNGVLRHLHRAALRLDGGGLTDGQLLERFLARREEAAFEALVRRHGPMVLGVCKRVLDHTQDAEDAFQATFLVFARKAASIITRDSVGNWLHGVAFRTAQKARAAAARRRVKEKHMAKPEALEVDAWRDLRPILDQELKRLPEKYREPVILCDLQGQTRKEAARRLGWPEGTLSGRLSRARVLLAKRLTHHGLTLSGGAVALALSHHGASACMSAPLVSSTVKAAVQIAAGHAVAAAVSAQVAVLTEGVLKAMLMTKAKIATAVILAVGLLGVGWGMYQSYAAPPEAPKEVNKGQASGAGAAAPAKEDNKAGDAEEKINLPTGPALTQVLASLDKDGKLVVKTTVTVLKPVGGVAPGPLPKLPPSGTLAHYEKTTIQSLTYDLDEVQIFDTKGKKLDKKDLPKLLKEETVAMASLWGWPVDPLHLRVLKDGTLTFVLPAPAPQIGIGAPAPPAILPPPRAPVPPAAPLPPGAAPPAPPAALPGLPAGAPPGNTAPVVPAPPAKPAPPGKP